GQLIYRSPTMKPPCSPLFPPWMFPKICHRPLSQTSWHVHQAASANPGIMSSSRWILCRIHYG
ncbi:hypothetical protein J6590_068194, partial [Homalodisca vitripennis]